MNTNAVTVNIPYDLQHRLECQAEETILRAYPCLEPEDIDEALSYAALLADEQVFEFAT